MTLAIDNTRTINNRKKQLMLSISVFHTVSWCGTINGIRRLQGTSRYPKSIPMRSLLCDLLQFGNESRNLWVPCRAVMSRVTGSNLGVWLFPSERKQSLATCQGWEQGSEFEFFHALKSKVKFESHTQDCMTRQSWFALSRFPYIPFPYDIYHPNRNALIVAITSVDA